MSTTAPSLTLRPRGDASSSARAAVIRFPGVNCEYETARALSAVGLRTDILPWTANAAQLDAYDAIVLPGGFSYEDRLRAGALAARESIMDGVVARADAGVPVLGVCNGAQVLVEAGLVPGLTPGAIEMGMGHNEVDGAPVGFLCRWATVRVTPNAASSLWTNAWTAETEVPWPYAHAEGRFTTRDPRVAAALRDEKLTPFTYADDPSPNGAMDAAAGVMNRRGNVLALMPHPERALWMWQVAWDLGGEWGAARRALGAAAGDAFHRRGPGWAFYQSLATALGVPAREEMRG